jgi:hypothetical protein
MGVKTLAAAAAVIVGLAVPARADDDERKDGDPFYRLDTKNLFGALEGADVGEAGDRSVELETTAALFKPSGRYALVEQEAIYEITPTPRLGIEFGAHGLGQSIRGIADVSNYSGVDFSGVSNEWRYVLVPHSGPWSAQATITLAPEASLRFEGGATGQQLDLPLLFILDAQPIARRLYADLNLLYAPQISSLRGEPWERASALSASGAMSWRITPEAMIGGEADVLNEFDGLAAQSWLGSAVFLGPTFHYQLSGKIDLSGAWTQQLAGWPHGPNLAQFTRSQAKLRLEIEF